MGELELITLFTDASFNNETCIGGGAFWAKGGKNGNAKLKGSFGIVDASDSCEAEALAALRSIGHLIENPAFHELLRKGALARLVLVTDCKPVIDMLNNGKGSLIRHAVAAEMENFKRIRNELGFLFKINWVKAHNTDDSARTWVNNYCDEGAKKARRRTEQRMIRDQVNEALKNPEKFMTNYAPVIEKVFDDEDDTDWFMCN